MKTIIIDGKAIRNIEDFHHEISDKLELNSSYGRNLDALWDSLTAGTAMPLTIRWINYQVSKEYLGEYAEQIVNLMRETEEELKNFTFELLH
ncbi:barstar family protein [Paenibacillus polymyxa]|uniref:barstar family protein n=1 Tax=Paenibacillus polymyxa TaxID=1406 RepID=UPI0025B6B6F9|nr:barstar family protein [Paenibacillus polymyxa]MDN4081280.1 barstar family protein [Paenibacillus polymyxa]MDN4106983.1 barstar family protein [Paenibacillus polymyxa]MDN4116931.1 barstar family protein [Paenibacillus polymyxa]